MKKVPKVGQQVVFSGNSVVGPCTGVVQAIYPSKEYDDDGFDWENDEGMPPVKGFAPESKWRVRLKCDERPLPWCYGADLVFAPEVAALEPCI